MLWIEWSQGKNIWHNSIEDDFIRFLPKSLGCEKESIRVWVIPTEAHSAVKALMMPKEDTLTICQRDGETLTLSRGKFVEDENKEKTFEAIEQIAVLISQATRSWPYEEKDGKLKFIGLM